MATISSKVKMLLSYYGRKQSDLMKCLNMSSKQSVNNKIARDSWSAQDLAKLAEFLGCKIGFILPDGTSIYLESNQDDDEGSAESEK